MKKWRQKEQEKELLRRIENVKQGKVSEHELVGGDSYKWSVEDMAERYHATPEFIYRVLLPFGIPYEMKSRYEEKNGRFADVETMEFDTEKVMEWELKTKCIGCGRGLPGCGLLPAYRDYLFHRKRSAGRTAFYLLCFLLSVYQSVFTPHIFTGMGAVLVFTICLYDQSMRKG